jgi:hypothetical protein
MIRLHALVLVLCAVLPLAGFAQVPSPPPLVPAPAVPQAEEEGPQDEIIPRDWEAQQSDGGKVGRLILGPLVGLVLGTVAAAPGVLLMADSFSCSTCGNDSEILGGGLLSLAGFTLGGTLGVKLMGSLFGGEGRYVHTLAGAGVGFGAGLLAMLPLITTEGGWAIPLIACPIIGAVVGYELSHSSERERKAASPAVVVLPSVGVSPLGGVIAGMVGRF